MVEAASLEQLLQKEEREEERKEEKREEGEKAGYSLARSDYSRKLKYFESIRIRSFPVVRS